MRVFPNIEKHGALFRQNFMLNQTSKAPAMVLWSDIGFPRTQFPTIHLLTALSPFLRMNRSINEFYYCWLALIQLDFLQYSIGQLTPYATFQILLISIAMSWFLRVIEFFWWFFGFLVFWKFSWPIIWCFRYFSFHFENSRINRSVKSNDLPTFPNHLLMMDRIRCFCLAFLEHIAIGKLQCLKFSRYESIWEIEF